MRPEEETEEEAEEEKEQDEDEYKSEDLSVWFVCFFLGGEQLLYNIVLASAKRHHESATLNVCFSTSSLGWVSQPWHS